MVYPPRTALSSDGSGLAAADGTSSASTRYLHPKQEKPMFKFIGGTIGIIFLIGLLVVIGILSLIF